MSLSNILLIPGVGGGVPNWVAMFANGEVGGVWIPGVSAAYTDSSGTTPASVSDTLGRLDDISGLGNHAIQATAANQPLLLQNRLSCSITDELRATFSSSVSLNVIRAIPGVGAQLQIDRVASNRIDLEYDNCGVVAIDRDFTESELTAIFAYFNKRSKLGGQYGLDTDLFSATKPLPAFVESWTTTGLSGVDGSAPNDPLIPTVPPDSDLSLEYTVSGSAGDTTLTISAGDEALFSNGYGGVVQHDDGTWSYYFVANIASSVMTIFPPLKADVTSKTMRNTGSAVNGQHLTEPAGRALAWNVFRTTNKTGYRNKYAARWSPITEGRPQWSPVNTTANRLAFLENNQFVASGTYQRNWLGRSKLALRVQEAISPYVDTGASQSWALGGKTGFMELWISALPTDWALIEYTVKLTVDSVETFSQSYIGIEHGYQRILVDFTNADNVTLEVTRTDSIAASIGFNIDGVTFWEYDRSITWTDRAIDINGKTVVIGDSWTRWSDDVFSDELQSLKTAAGGTGTVVNVGLGGQTAEWGLANFDTLVAPENPDDFVILFF
jgi:hypothetical protein